MTNDIRDFLLPDLGEGLTEGEIVRWLVAVGDRVEVDQPVAEISTEKAVVEVPTPFAGVVTTLHGAPGDVVAVGRALITIDTFATFPAGEPATVPPAEEAEVAPSRSDAETREPVATAAAASTASGNVLVGYGTSTSARRRRRAGAAEAGSSGAAPPTDAPPAAGRLTTPASPLVRRLAAELGVDLAGIRGSGPGGLVTRTDLERSAAAAPATSGEMAASERIRLVGPRRVAAERLAQVHREVPAASAWLAADATRLLELRSLLGERHPDARITPLALLLRLCVTALGRFPLLNARFDAATGESVVARAIHLGVAVQAPQGLLVPVIRNAQTRSALAIAAELERLAAAARDASIGTQELSGSTFTVSNFGAFGVDGGTPLINLGEAAILGVGTIGDRPWVVGGEVVPRKVVELSLVFDHRVCEGGVAGGFLRLLGDLVEQPALALAEG